MIYDKPVTLQMQNEETELWEDALYLHANVNKTLNRSGGVTSVGADAEQFHDVLNFRFRYCKALEEHTRYSPQLCRLVYREHTYQIVDYDDYQEQHKEIKLVGQLYE